METRVDREFVLHHIPKRPRSGHKGTFGTLTVLGGSSQYRGAPLLAADAALRTGAGLVRVASIEAVCAAAALRLPALLLRPLPEAEGAPAPEGVGDALADAHTALLAGCGLSQGAEVPEVVCGVLGAGRQPLVLDADGLNVLAGLRGGEEDEALAKRALGLFRLYRAPKVITPHIGEMARLTGLDTAAVQAAQADTAAEYATRHACVVVLKSHRTIIASPAGGVFVVDEGGNPGLAKGGSGDVLAGAIASLLAQGFAPELAACCGAWLHAAAGKKLAQAQGEAGLSVADLPAALAGVLHEMER